jgi:hypothetical protein
MYVKINPHTHNIHPPKKQQSGGGGGGALAGSSITHLIVDEVHERNLDADFLLLLARRLLLEEGQNGGQG